MSYLPEDLWRRILEIGIVNNSCLTYKDLCCLSISSRCLNHLSSENSLWNHLISSDFDPSLLSSSSHSSKTLYKSKFEREKKKRLAAHRRVLRKQDEINQHHRRILDIHKRVVEETAKATQIASELSNLRSRDRTPPAYYDVPFSLLKPHMVKQYVEFVVSESRINIVETKLNICERRIEVLQEQQRIEELKLEYAREALLSLNSEAGL